MKLKLRLSRTDSEMLELLTETDVKTYIWAVVHIDFIHGSMIHDMLKETGELEVYLTENNPDKMMLRPEF